MISTLATFILVGIMIYCASCWIMGGVKAFKLLNTESQTSTPMQSYHDGLDTFEVIDRNMFHHGACAILCLIGIALITAK